MMKDEQQAFQALNRLVGVRPRTESEVSRRLVAKGFPAEVVQRVIEWGRQAGLLDDQLFARLYAEDRLLSRPCSRRLLAQELRRKGIDPAVAQAAANNALPEADEAELATRALAGGQALWQRLSPEAARRRAAAFLLRRGFSQAVARRALDNGYEDEG
ncbi:MAG: regulatory protein RecX [Candidatus Bipolaricaulota bacterium]